MSRALTILEVMAEEEDSLGLSAISRLVDLDPSTTYRLLHTMHEHGFISQSASDGKYSLGVRVFQVGSAVTQVTLLRQVIRPFLQVLMERTGETANLAVKVRFAAAYLEQVTGLHFPRTYSEVGRSVPLHATAIGKALLIGAGEAELERLAAHGLRRYSPNTITTARQLRVEARRCTERGYAIDNEEFEPGLTCLGAAIVSSEGKVLCAISVSGPTVRMSSERIQELIPVMTKTAAEIAQALRVAHPGAV